MFLLYLQLFINHKNYLIFPRISRKLISLNKLKQKFNHLWKLNWKHALKVYISQARPSLAAWRHATNWLTEMCFNSFGL